MRGITDTNLKQYALIDWDKPPPVLPSMTKREKLTRVEAQTLNNALRMNRTTLRWILDE